MQSKFRLITPNCKLLVLGAAIILAVSARTSAQMVEINDPSLPASPDGFNITEHTATGLQWLDITVTEGRTYGDMIGTDGSDEFGPGGDFEGFRYATFLELTGWTGGPQGESPFKHFGFTSEFASIGGYPPVRDYMSYFGCLANCVTYGFVTGLYIVNDTPPITTRWSITQAFPSGGWNYGRLDAYYTFVPTSWPTNGSSMAYGHYIVRLPEPGAASGLLAGAAMLYGLTCRRRHRIGGYRTKKLRPGSTSE
jgi:hypothetical protein